MRRRLEALGVGLLVMASACAGACPALASAECGSEAASKLAPSLLRAAQDRARPTEQPAVLRGAQGVPELWLAQRTIDREWGLSDDSTYRTVDVPGWKLEGLALVLSGAVPGAGQLYVGEGSGWVYLLGEAAGWVGRMVTRRRAQDLRDDAAAFVGDPTDSTSTWSFARYAAASGGEAVLLEQLWTQDRDAFYQVLARDEGYRVGFAGSDPSAQYDSYRGLRDSSQDRFRQSRYFEMALLLNHAVGAFEALRAARIHNLPLRRNLDLQFGGRWHHGEPQLRAAVVGSF
jgi:hypothetical protein